MNFHPTRPLDEIAREYVDAFWELYDPIRYLNRVHRYFLGLGPPRATSPFLRGVSQKLGVRELREVLTIVGALLRVVWRQGVKRETRWLFWHHLASIVARNPNVLGHYLAVCAHNEHYLEYRETIRNDLEARLAEDRSFPAAAVTRSDDVAEAVSCG
jgi:hypothetical protein